MWIWATVFTDPAGCARGCASLGAFYAAASERIQLTQPLPRADRPLFKLAPACCSGLWSDFLLHDIDTGDGIVQTPPEGTANKLRTAPLWPARTSALPARPEVSHTRECDRSSRRRGGGSPTWIPPLVRVRKGGTPPLPQLALMRQSVERDQEASSHVASVAPLIARAAFAVSHPRSF